MSSAVINATGRSLSSGSSSGAATSRTISSGSSGVYYAPNTRATNEYNGGYNGVQDYLSLYNMNNARYDQIANMYNSLNKMSNKEYNKLLYNFIDKQRDYNYNLMNTVNKYNDTSYQRLVKDLKAAGLNPMLATYNVSPYRVSSVPYSTNIPNFSEYKYERPEIDKNNYFSDLMNLFITFLNNANSKELAQMKFGFDTYLQNQSHLNKIDEDYRIYLHNKNLSDNENNWKWFLQNNDYLHQANLNMQKFEQDKVLSYQAHKERLDEKNANVGMSKDNSLLQNYQNLFGFLLSHIPFSAFSGGGSYG